MLNENQKPFSYRGSATERIMDAILHGGHVELERRRKAASKAELKPLGEVDAPEKDERPKDPMPSDEEIEDMHRAYLAGEKGQNRSEAYRLAHD
jgi:hypothetical protein